MYLGTWAIVGVKIEKNYTCSFQEMELLGKMWNLGQIGLISGFNTLQALYNILNRFIGIKIE